jgi:hypothetical protein
MQSPLQNLECDRVSSIDDNACGLHRLVLLRDSLHFRHYSNLRTLCMKNSILAIGISTTFAVATLFSFVVPGLAKIDCDLSPDAPICGGGDGDEDPQPDQPPTPTITPTTPPQSPSPTSPPSPSTNPTLPPNCVAEPRDFNIFVYRNMGVNVKCSREVSRLSVSCSVRNFDGISVTRSDRCTNCSELIVFPIEAGGFLVPQLATSYSYSITGEVDGKPFEFNGSGIYGTGQSPEPLPRDPRNPNP